jgi:hypothetical protein
MKTKKLELEVDFIGGQTALTLAEEKALSDFFKQRKINVLKSNTKQLTKTIKKEKLCLG